MTILGKNHKAFDNHIVWIFPVLETTVVQFKSVTRVQIKKEALSLFDCRWRRTGSPPRNLRSIFVNGTEFTLERKTTQTNETLRKPNSNRLFRV